MKKKSRFLTGLLSAVMALSLCAMPAMAAEGETNVATIDTTKRGSLTIEKYEGEEGDFSKPFPGIDFTIYQVADIEQEKDASGNVLINYVSKIDGLTITAGTTYSDIKTQIDEAVNANKLTGQTATTKLEGNGTEQKAVARFNGLPLGIYLVVETKAPSQVVTPSANFLVSIPMTKADGTGWDYNVVAQPKNATVYGGVHLVKTGTTLKPDGTKPETPLAGVTFALQSYDKETNAWSTVDGKDNLTTDKDGKIDIDGLAPGKYRFVETAGVNGYIADGATPHEFTVDASKPDENIKVEVNNEKPDLDKTVKNAAGNYGTDADYSVGDMVEWKVSVTVPSNVDKLKTFKITDTMSSQMTWSEKKAALTIATTPAVELDTSDYELAKPVDGKAGDTWTITFTPTGKKKLKENSVTNIDVTFKTELNATANIGETGNLNNAKLEYSNAIYPTKAEQPDNPNGGKNPKEDVIEDEAIIYAFKLDAVKVDGSNVSTKLPGAEFDLYRYEGTKDDPTEADLKDDNHKVGHYVSSDDGALAISGLKKGNYYLVETKAPTYNDDKGNKHFYNLLKEPVKVAIQPTYTTTTKNTTTTVDGVTTTKTEIDTKTFTENGTDGHFSVTIKNNKGFDLPVTGGFGTLLFSAIGALLVVGGVGVLMSTKKKKGNG